MLRPPDHREVYPFLASDDSRFVTGQVIQINWLEPGAAAEDA